MNQFEEFIVTQKFIKKMEKYFDTYNLSIIPRFCNCLRPEIEILSINDENEKSIGCARCQNSLKHHKTI